MNYEFRDPLSEKIFNSRYAFHPEENWPQACERVASHVARADKDFPRWSETFYDQIVTGRFMPGGRIWYGSGRPLGQLLNCFVTPTGDSREDWGRCAAENIIIAGTGGGNGENYSPIRPRGSEIKGTGGHATGPVSLMKIENAVLEEVKGGGGRRAARMACLDINHPDIEEFLECKLDLNQLNNMNVSTVFMFDPEEFFQAVKDDSDFDLTWKSNVYKTVKARSLWEKIVSHALKNGEPGVLNGYLANKQSNIWYCRTLVSTNPCGEIFMQPYSTCCLGAIVLPRFVKASVSKYINNRIDWEGLHHAITTGVRFLDNVLDVTHYPTPELKAESEATRRIGLGIMGLHHFLIKLGFRYSSDEGREFVDKVMCFIKNTAYDASIALAIEKGSFPEYDRDKFQDSGFIKTLKPSIRNKIKTYGIRNCAILTIAPTGTTSMAMPQGIVTSGIEPMFAKATLRKWYENNSDNVSRSLKEEVLIDGLYKEFLENNLDTSVFEEASDIHPEDHLKMQVVCQKHIDNAVSKTINFPQDKYTAEMLSDLYMKYLPELKGITVYPEGSREDSPLTRLSEEEARQYLPTAAVSGSDDCVSGTCNI